MASLFLFAAPHEPHVQSSRITCRDPMAHAPPLSHPTIRLSAEVMPAHLHNYRNGVRKEVKWRSGRVRHRLGVSS